MPLYLTSGPAAEPVSLEEAKIHCRIDSDAEDMLISSLILAARLHIEQNLNLALITQSWSLFLDRWPDTAHVELPLAPLISLDAVRLHSPTDSVMTLDPGLFYADKISRRPRLALRLSQSWPLPGRAANGIEIAMTAGYGPNPEDVPMPIRQAIKMLVAHWYEAREPITLGDDAESIPATIASLVHPYRAVRL